MAEILETEDKYGRDLNIVREHFRAPMKVSGFVGEGTVIIFLKVYCFI